MSPLLFVILLGLLAGFALFALVIGVGAVTSALLNKRQNRREANSEQQVATGEFATVLAGEAAAEVEATPQPLAQEVSFSTVREVEPAQVYSLVEHDEGTALDVNEDDAAEAAEPEPTTKNETVGGHRGSKFLALKRRTKSQPKSNKSSAADERVTSTEPDVFSGADSIEPKISEPAPAALVEGIASADRNNEEGARLAPATAESQPQAEPDEAVGEPPAQPPAAAQVTGTTPRRSGLFPKRIVEPAAEAEPELAAVAPKTTETPATPKPALEDPFAAVLAAVNKH